MSDTRVICTCGEEMEYVEPYPADEATNVVAWRGGYLCCGCLAQQENEPIDWDAIGKYDGLKGGL